MRGTDSQQRGGQSLPSDSMLASAGSLGSTWFRWRRRQVRVRCGVIRWARLRDAGLQLQRHSMELSDEVMGWRPDHPGQEKVR